MSDNMRNDIAIKVSGVKKMYRLGQIGGGTLQADLQSWWARVRGKEDPNLKIGEEDRSYGDTFMALNGIDMTIYQGEAVGIIGKNGAGKSTLLKLLSKVTAPTTGEIDDEKMEEIIEFSEVREFIDTPVKRYSSGMYVKLAFSVAAHLNSEIMIMDEVLAVGDMAFQKKCLTKMREAAKQEGRTVLYVSHNMNTIRHLCDRCIVLDKGKVIFEGDVEKAISVYMYDEAKSLGVDIDLSENRMPHLPKRIRGKITHLTLLEKDCAVYSVGEHIKTAMEIKANEALKDISLRIEIRSLSGYSVGITMINNFASISKGESKKFSFDLNYQGLVTGEYAVCLVLYEADDVGSFVDLDAIYPAFVFEVRDIDNKLRIAWDHSNWGYVKFPDTVLLESDNS